MMGLTVIIFFGLYLLIAIWVTRKAVNWAKANHKRPWVWGGLAAFVMYNLVFWDWIPTLITHKYYCSTQAGYWVYKTPEQWLKENPKQEIVTYQETASNDFKQEKIEQGNKTTFTVNKRSKIKFTELKTTLFPLIENRRVEETLFDKNQNFLLTRKISFEAGHTSGAPRGLSDFRFWINIEQCKGSNGNTIAKIWKNSVNDFMRLGASND